MEDVKKSSFFFHVFKGLCEKIWANFPFPYFHNVKLCNETFLCNKPLIQKNSYCFDYEMFKGKTYVYLMNDLNKAKSLDMCDECPIECSQHKIRV
jgi:hypothetical protein